MKNKVIFFGNGPLADFTLEILEKKYDIIFHAHTKDDLEKVKQLKAATPDTFGILASFGVLIKDDILALFGPEGILNIHPSKLPDLRGPSPIETAIMRGDKEFSVSIMKLVKAMDAGPLYFQKTLSNSQILELAKTDKTPENGSPKYPTNTPNPPKKLQIYEILAKTGANLLPDDLKTLPNPVPQPEEGVSYSKKLSVSMSELSPATKPAETLRDEIRALENFPKSRYVFNGIDCIILEAHVADNLDGISPKIAPLCLKCSDGKYLIIDRLQPANKKPMDAKSFANGYLK